MAGKDRETDRRMELAKIAGRMTVNPEMRHLFPKSEDRPRRIVIALETETVGDLFSRIGPPGGKVNVIVGSMSSKKFEVIVFSPEISHAQSGKEAEELRVGPSSEVGLLLAALRQSRRSMGIVLEQPKFSLELVDGDGPLQAV